MRKLTIANLSKEETNGKGKVIKLDWQDLSQIIRADIHQKTIGRLPSDSPVQVQQGLHDYQYIPGSYQICDEFGIFIHLKIFTIRKTTWKIENRHTNSLFL